MIARIYLFFNWLIISSVVILILLMVLRMIANGLDLNPFAWSARTIRHLTDPMIRPVRRVLVSFGVDGKYSPLVVILLTVLLAWFAIQILSGLANTIIGMTLSLREGAIVPSIGYLLYGLLGLYSLLIFIRIILSWGMMSYGNRLMRFLSNVTDPLLLPLRRMIPPVGMFDISPIVAFAIIWILQLAVVGTLLRGLTVNFLS